MPRPNVPVLALFAVLSCASAQVGGALSSTLAAPEFAGFQRSGNVLTGPGGATVTFTPRTGASGTVYVQGASVLLPTFDPLLAGKLLSGATGQDLTQSLVDYLNRPAARAALAAGFTANAAPFNVALKTAGKGLSLSVTLQQQTGFAPVPANRVQGALNAPHVMRLYSDFQCPYCQKAELETLPAVLRALPADVRFEFHHLPLTQIHPNALPAAEASVCAAAQGRFFPFKDALFRRNDWQKSGNPGPVFVQAAAAAGLNTQAFQGCVNARSGRAEVSAGLAEATALGLRGTPTVFIDGYQVADPYDPASYQALLDFVRGK